MVSAASARRVLLAAVALDWRRRDLAPLAGIPYRLLLRRENRTHLVAGKAARPMLIRVREMVRLLPGARAAVEARAVVAMRARAAEV